MAPLVVFADQDRLKTIIEYNLWYTHSNFEALYVCYDYVKYLRRLLNGGEKNIDTNSSITTLVSKDLFFKITVCNQGIDIRKKACESNGFQIKCSDAFVHAYYYFITYTDPMIGLFALLKYGGDTDTVAKLYCEMVGCVSDAFNPFMLDKVF